MQMRGHDACLRSANTSVHEKALRAIVAFRVPHEGESAGCPELAARRFSARPAVGPAHRSLVRNSAACLLVVRQATKAATDPESRTIASNAAPGDDQLPAKHEALHLLVRPGGKIDRNLHSPLHECAGQGADMKGRRGEAGSSCSAPISSWARTPADVFQSRVQFIERIAPLTTIFRTLVP